MMRRKTLFTLVVIMSFFYLGMGATPRSLHAASPSPTSLGGDCTTSDGKPGVQTGPGCIPKDANPNINQSSDFGQRTAGSCAELKANNIISADGFIAALCRDSPGQNAVQTLIESLSNFVFGLGAFVFGLMIALGMMQILTGGASPEALKAGRRRITLAITSIALFFSARIIFDLLGITGQNRFLGVVDLNNFNSTKIIEIIGAIFGFVQFTAGISAVAMIIYGGIKLMTSAGNPQQIQAARKIITYAVIGLVGVIMSGLVFGLVQRIITGR